MMKITVRVKPNARVERVEKLDEHRYTVSVKAPPVEGRANEAVIAALAAHFGIAKRRIRLVSGRVGRQKVFEVV